MCLLVPIFRFCQKMPETHKRHISYLSASECKPCPQPRQSPSDHLSVQPHTCSGTGSSSSLSPASIAEDVFFNSTNEDQVKVHTSGWDHFPFFRSSFRLSTFSSLSSSSLLEQSSGVTLVLVSADVQNILLISLPPFFPLLPLSGSILHLSASSPPLLICRTLVQ